jgi:AcrR family transcriptional regulator
MARELGPVASELGLRARKKEQTRQLIGETARRLFTKRGFDAVTVSDVAQEANVSEGTVFNYFPTKEDLFYSGAEAFEAQLIDAVRDRPTGEVVLAAFERVVLDGIPRLARSDVADLIATATRVVASSQALQGRERELIARYTEELAGLIAEETGRPAGDVEAAAVAAALMGVQRAVVAYVHASVVAGRRGAKLATDSRNQTRRAFHRLEAGLRDYAVKPGRLHARSNRHRQRRAGGETG